MLCILSVYLWRMAAYRMSTNLEKLEELGYRGIRDWSAKVQGLIKKQKG